MQIIQSRRDFLASLSAAGAAGVLGARASLADEGPPETTTIRLAKIPTSASRLCTSPRSCCGRKGSPMSATCRRRRRHRSRVIARGEIDFCLTLRGAARHPDGCRRADHGHWRVCIPGATSCSRNEPVRTHQRPEGQEGRHAGPRLQPAPVPRHHGDPCRARPAQGHRLGHQPIGQADGAVRRRQDRCLPRLSARAAGAARPQHRPRDRQQRTGPALVAVFLLHGVGQHGLRPRSSGRDQALPARHPQGRRHLRHRAGARRTAAGRWRVHRSATTTRSRR